MGMADAHAPMNGFATNFTFSHFWHLLRSIGPAPGKSDELFLYVLMYFIRKDMAWQGFFNIFSQLAV